jgi:adenylate cyclase
VRPIAIRNTNSLELVVAPGVGNMHSDATRIRQCLLNLLSNAAKFTQNGAITLHVERVLEGPRPFLRFAVSDNGAGMPAEEMHRLFEPFSQLESHDRTKGHGTGLGLAITRRLSRMLGGDTIAESRLGQGSVFTLTLPEEVSPGAIAASRQPSADTRPAVLVIDDDADIHGIVRRLFLRQPLEVASAYDPDEALRTARRLRPRVILLEVQMERADGWSILHRLKADEELASIPVILCSFLDVRHDSRAFLAAEILTKPIDLERLSVAIFRHAASPGARTALIVEDDPAARHSLRQPLEQIGWTVTEASDGEEALARFAAVAPSLVVLDLRLPRVDGFEFLARLRSSEAGRSTPVIVVTAMDLDNAQRKRLQNHAASLVPKAGMRSPDLIAQVIASLPASS